MIACSNYMRALHLDDKDRRWLVPRVTEVLRDQQYWEDFYGWLREDGLGIILNYLNQLAQDPANIVARGGTAPTSSTKDEVIAKSRTVGEQVAHDLGEIVLEMNTESEERPGDMPKKVVLSVDDVREHVARYRQIAKDDPRLEKARVIKMALVQAGLQEPKLLPNQKQRRYLVDSTSKTMTYVVANFQIEPNTEWKNLKLFHKKVQDIQIM